MTSAPKGQRHGVTFRPAGKDDVASIAILHTKSWKLHYRGMMSDEFLDNRALSNRLEVWSERLAGVRFDQFVCVAELDRRLVGFVCAFGNEDAQWGSYIDNLHVASEYKRRGVGCELMARAGEWLHGRFHGFGVYLWVMEANHAARRFYERLGATDAGTTLKEDPGGGSAPNCRYVWASARLLESTARLHARPPPRIPEGE